MSANNLVLCQASQGAQGAQGASSRKPLSCTNCRQRKVKCNKASPCDPCLRSGIECIFPSRRIRAPRARQHASEARDAELLRRIRRLEMLVSKADAGNLNNAVADGRRPDGSDPGLVPPHLSNDASSGGPQVGFAVDDQYASFVKQQGSSSRHLNTEFWTGLSDEFDGLRQLLERHVDDEDGDDDTVSDPTGATDSSPRFIWQDPDSVTMSEVSYPSEAHRGILCQFFFARVDQVCKILHRPTVIAYLSDSEALLDHSTGRFRFKSLEAVAFAMYFASVTSMSPQECMTYFGEEKDVLLAEYKRNTEAALAQADFLNSMEIATLQAFVLYIVARRSHDKTRSSWTLIGLAVRIAHGLGLHRDGDGRAFGAFEAEMRRRLWWQISALDMRACEDRGFEPVVAESSSNTEMPCNLNDEDFGYDSQHPIRGRNGPTEMTFCLLCMDALNTARKINSAPFTSGRQALTLQEQEKLVKDYTERVESCYLAGCDPSDQRTWLPRMMGRYWILKLWLISQYPLHSPTSAQRIHSGEQSLRTAVAFLTIAEQLERNELAAGFAWYFKTTIPWHPVAVALSELCTQTQGPLVDRAWDIINKGFEMWNNRVADTKEAMLWRPIKSLLKRARAARQRSQRPSEAGAASELSALDSILRDCEELTNLGLEGGTSNIHDDMMINDLGLTYQTSNLPLELDPFTSTDLLTASTEPPSAPGDWDNWNEFMFDVAALDVDIPPDSYER